MKTKGAVHTLSLSTVEGTYSGNITTSHQLGFLLVSLSLSFPPNKLILKIDQNLLSPHTSPENMFSHISSVYQTLVDPSLFSVCLVVLFCYYITPLISV